MKLIFTKCLRIMKIAALLLTVINLSVMAADGFSQQKITLEVKNATLKELIHSIAEESGTRFIYNADLLDKFKAKRTLEVHNEPLEAVIVKVLLGTNLTHEIVDKVVVIKRSNVKTTQLLLHYNNMIQVTGKVTSATGETLPGVNVVEKGTTNGTVTDIDGNYDLDVAENSTLMFSFIGYKTKEVLLNNQFVIDISLEEDIKGLEEMVVIGYGTTTRKDLTGSVARVDSKLLESNTYGDIGVALQGQISGVNILTGDGSPGEPVQISIRGVTSLLGTSSPLIVVDEVPMPSEFNLNDLNPQDIESMDVLKGASSAAIYGSRAANGVIIVKTKKGNLGEKSQINYSYNYGVNQLTTDIDVLSAEEWKYMIFEGVKNAAIYNGFADVNGFIQYDKFITPGYFGEYNTNWLGEMLQNSDFHNHNLSVSGGSPATTYAASLGYTKDQGMMKNSEFARYNVSLALTTQVSDKFNFGVNIRGNLSDREVATETLAGATKGRPDIRAYNDDGSLFLNTYLQNGNGQRLLIETPLATLLDNQNLSTSHTVSASSHLQYEPIDGLNFKTRLNYYTYNSNQKLFYANTTTAGSGFGFVKAGSLYDSDNRTTQIEWENTANYKKSFGVHAFDLVLGTSYLTEDRKNTRISFDDFPDNKVQTEIYQGATFKGVTGYHYDAYMMSYISRLNYKFSDRYLITGSFRRDGSSKFSSDNAYGNFPAIAVAWIASEEDFMKPISWINLLKLRASTGKTGMSDVGYYRWRTTYEATSYNGAPAVIPDQTGNENLQWESTIQRDLGLDFNLFDSRVNGSIVFYVKETDGLLYPFTMAPSTGYSNATVNFAEIKNSGVDIDLQVDILRNSKLFWSVGFNFNNNKNLVQKLDKDYITSTDGSQSLRNSIIKEGESLGLIYGFKTQGIYTSEEQIAADQALNPDENYQRDRFVGEVRYVDLNGDGYVDMSTASAIGNEDRTIIGRSLPKFSGGINTTLKYQNWTLNVFGSYSYGNDKVWVNELYNFGTSQTQPGNVWRSSLNRWTPENPNSPYPAFRLNRTFPSREFNDFSVHDASFLKIQNVHLEYKLAKNILEKLKIVNNLRLYVSVNNVHVFTKYPGPNPESYTRDDVIQGAALDYSQYPQDRTYNMGIKVNFK